MAGGSLRLGSFGDTVFDDDHLLELLFDDIARRFFKALHLDERVG
ncbi:hypothetical protein [Natrinema sp. 1APR25-10V2]|nr:hypothetical protein [Natrinema sp. 1APR25-10V2]